MQLTDQVVIQATSIEDARSKVAKFVKRGAVESPVRSDDLLQSWLDDGRTLHVTVYWDGEVAIQNHGCQPATWLKRVRDVEKHYVKD